MPGILAISFGATFKTDRAQGFTHALVVDLESKEALEVQFSPSSASRWHLASRPRELTNHRVQVYAAHPDHVEIVTNDLKPNFEGPPCAMDYEFDL